MQTPPPAITQYETPVALSTPSAISVPTMFLEAEILSRQQQEAEAVATERAKQLALDNKDGENYQAAIAASLDLGGAPAIPSPDTRSSSSQQIDVSVTPIPLLMSHFRPAIPRNLAPVQTIPYCEPVITHHMNPDWMRTATDNTKKSMKVVRANPNNKFAIVFWGQVNIFHALFQCRALIIIRLEDRLLLSLSTAAHSGQLGC
jgi:hypothetical protein